jgi:hypothetical protein
VYCVLRTVYWCTVYLAALGRKQRSNPDDCLMKNSSVQYGKDTPSCGEPIPTARIQHNHLDVWFNMLSRKETARDGRLR